MADITLKLEADIPHCYEVGRGAIQLVRGSLSCQAARQITRVEIIDAKGLALEQYSELFLAGTDVIERNEDQYTLNFISQITWQAENVGSQHDLFVRVYFDNDESVNKPLGKVKLVADRRAEIEVHSLNEEKPLVAICMATYCPDLFTFQRQIDSILLQNYQNWHLVVCDDASQISHWKDIEAVCRSDPQRITLVKHKENKGFYHNFERVLNYVPSNARYIAFADQDDVWYPEKLTSLVNTLQSTHTSLVYSDMRVVKEDGEVIANTYWQDRKNEYQDFDTVFLANTVTGAASLFDRSLLDVLLPFPEKIGDAFHDHWLACVALAKGPISYADKPLHDYYQYGNSVIGHCDFKRWSFTDRLKSTFGLAKRMLKPTSFRRWVGVKVGGGLGIYKGECLRLRLIADTIKLRGSFSESKYTTLNLLNGRKLAAARLLLTHLKMLVKGKTTDDAEFRLAMGCLAREAEIRKIAKGDY